MATDLNAWLAQVQEAPIEPDLPILDPHHHLWERNNQRYFLDEFLADLACGHHIVQTVFVECTSMYRTSGPEAMRPVGETEYVRAAAEEAQRRKSKTDVVAGITGLADMTLGDAVTPVLEAHVQAGKGRFKGIRGRTAMDPHPSIGVVKPPPKLLLDANFRKGVAALHRMGLVFESHIYHHQLHELTDLAKAFPDLPIILNHVGSPIYIGPYASKRDEVTRQWRQGIADLAKHPNVTVKLGGLGRVVSGFRWQESPKPPSSEEVAKQVGPFYRYCIEQFGVSRCMFESNFPVDKTAYSYGVMWNAFKRIVKDASRAEKVDLFHNTAARVYSLPLVR